MSTKRPADPGPADDALDQAWRATSNEEPPAGIDAAILAAARREAGRAEAARATRARRDWWTGWQPFAAAAAVAVLAFTLVQTIPRDREVVQQVTLERAPAALERVPSAPAAVEPAPSAPAAEAADSTSASETSDTAPAPAIAKSRETEVPEFAAQAGRAEDAATTGEGTPAASSSGVAAESRDLTAMPSRTAARAPAPPLAEAPTAAPASPEDWAARITMLHDTGDQATAAMELRAFRASYGAAEADRHLPDTLQAWAATVK